MTNQASTIKLFNSTIIKILIYFIITNLAIGSVLYFFHVDGQQKGLFSAISEKTKTIGSSVENLINKGIDTGIPLHEMKGMNEYLERKLKETKEVEYIIVTDISGNVLYQTTHAPSSLKSTLKQFALNLNPNQKEYPAFNVFSFYNIPIPIDTDAQDKRTIHGFLHLGVSTKAVQNSITDISFDIAVILFVSLIIGFEFLRFTFRNHVIVPIIDLMLGIAEVIKGNLLVVSAIRVKNQSYACLELINSLIKERAKKVYDTLSTIKKIDKKNSFYDILQEYMLEVKLRIKTQIDGIPKISAFTPDVESIRIVIFLVMICEGIGTTVLPGYAAQFWTANSYFSKQFISASPVVIFMATVMCVVPFGPMLSSKFGFHKAINTSLIFYILGFLVTVIFEKSLFMVLLTRFLNGIGFGVFYILIQNYVSTYSAAENRIKSYSIFSIAYGAAFITGIPIGGILVDNVGSFYTFLLCLIISTFSLLYSNRYILDYEGFKQQSTPSKLINPLHIKKMPGLATTIIYLGFPARFLATALLPVFEPLFLESLGNSMSVIGRVMMVFGILMFCFAPASYKLINLFKKPATSTFMCSLLLLASLMLQFFFPNIIGVSIAIAVLSIGLVVHTSAMMATLEEIATTSKEHDARNITISLYFTYERIAMVCGPFVSSLLIGYAGFEKTLLILSAFLILANILYYISNSRNHLTSLQGD